MTRRAMFEPAAWREVARQIAEDGLVGGGICQNVTKLFLAGRIDPRSYRVMRDRVVYHLGPTDFFDDRGVPGSRILAALLMAEESSDTYGCYAPQDGMWQSASAKERV